MDGLRSKRVAPAHDADTPPSNQEAAMTRRESFEEYEASDDDVWDESHNPTQTRTKRRKPPPRPSNARPPKRSLISNCVNFVSNNHLLETKTLNGILSSANCPRVPEVPELRQQQDSTRALLTSIEGDDNGWTKLLIDRVDTINENAAGKAVPWCTFSMVASLQRFYHKSNDAASKKLLDETAELRSKCEQWQDSLRILASKKDSPKRSDSEYAEYQEAIRRLKGHVKSEKAKTAVAGKFLDMTKAEQQKQSLEFRKLQQTLHKCQSDLSRESARLGRREDWLTAMTDQCTTAKSKLRNSEQKCTRLQNSLNSETLLRKFHEHEHARCKEKTNSACLAKTELQNTFEQWRKALERERKDHSTALDDLEGELETERTAVRNLESKIKQLTLDLRNERNHHSKAMDELKGDLEPKVVQLRLDLETERMDHSSAITDLREENTSLLDVAAREEKTTEYLRERLDAQDKANQDLQAENESLSEKFAEMERRLQLSQSLLKKEQENREAADQESGEALHSMRARLNAQVEINGVLQSEIELQKDLVGSNQNKLQEANRISEEQLESKQAEIKTLSDTAASLTRELGVQQGLTESNESKLQGANAESGRQLESKQAEIDTLSGTVEDLGTRLGAQEGLVKSKTRGLTIQMVLAALKESGSRHRMKLIDEAHNELQNRHDSNEAELKKAEHARERERHAHELTINRFKRISNFEDRELAEGSLNPTISCLHQDQRLLLRCFELVRGGLLLSLLADDVNTLWAGENPKATLLWHDNAAWLDLGVTRQGIRLVKLDRQNNSDQTLRWLQERFPLRRTEPNDLMAI